MRRITPITAWLVFALGCYGDGNHRFTRVEGGLCSSRSPSRCVDSTRLLECVAREWTVLDCATVCVERGQVPRDESCFRRGDGDHCVCTTVDELCADMPTACGDADQLDVCSEGEWTSHACAEVCAAQTPPRTSLGCEDASWLSTCACTLEGAPCDEPAPRCDGAGILAICVDGQWVLESCAESCAAGELPVCLSAIDDDDGPMASCDCL